MRSRPLTIRWREFRRGFNRAARSAKRHFVNRRTFLVALWIVRFVVWILRNADRDSK